MTWAGRSIGGKGALPLMGHVDRPASPASERVRGLIGGALVVPSRRVRPEIETGRLTRWRHGVAGVLLAAALFSLSWERLANLDVGPYNVKFPVIAFALVALLTAPRWVVRVAQVATARRERSASRAVVLVVLVLIAYVIVRAMFVSPLTSGVAAVVSVLTGAVLPAAAIVGVIGSLDDVAWACGWIVRGAVFASVFGLYQLFALYTGLPQIVEYRGLGTDGVTGRIAAFSYEPAYFAYFIVMAIGALVVRRTVQGRTMGWGWLVFFAVILSLANVRALMFLLPVVALLLAVSWRANRRLIVRGAVVAVVIAALAVAAPAAVSAAQKPVVSTSSAAVASGSAVSPSASATDGSASDADAADGSSKSGSPVQAPDPGSVLDPNQVSSNAPRLELYKAVLAVDLSNAIVGVGPGGLQAAVAPRMSTTPGIAVVANNIWLQAGADGGLILLLLEAACVVGMAVIWLRGRRGPTQVLGATWLSVLLVGGMLTSYFFDLKIWVVGALLLVGLSATRAAAVRGGEGSGGSIADRP